MPRGFSGAAAERFFIKTNEAMEKASEAHNKRPFNNTPEGGASGNSQNAYTYGMTNQGVQGLPTEKTAQETLIKSSQGMYTVSAQGSSSISLPNFREPQNHKTPFSPEDANPLHDRHKTGVDNRSNIVVEQDIYEDAVKQMEAADDKAGEEIYKMACKIEEICKTIYIVPETNPRAMAITGRAKDCLSKFRELTEEVNIQVKQYVSEIGHIDKAPDGFKVVVSDEGAEHVISGIKSSAGKQVQSMEDTARSYAQGIDSLKHQANSLNRQADTTKNQIDMLETRVDMLEQRESMERAVGLGNPLNAVNPFRVV